jgi:GT2 family glycosyltransferase
MANKVYIVLLNYNGFLDTVECLESVLKLKYENFQIIVIDNSETQNSFENLTNWALGNFAVKDTSFENLVFPLEQKPVDFCTISEDYFLEKELNPKIVFVKANQNKGFAAGNNIALKYILKFGTPDSYIWLLNNDTVVDKEALNAQILYFSKLGNKGTGILGSKLIYYHKPDKIQAIGGNFNKKFYISSHICEGESIFFQRNTTIQIDYIIGASMFVALKFVKDVGILCEDFFLYYEELDWTYRARKKGWNIDYCPESIVYHKEGASIGSSYDSKKKSFFSEITIFKSRKQFVKKHFKLGFNFYFSSLALILNRVRKGKIRLALELLKITVQK